MTGIGRRVALFADVHAATRLLDRALTICAAESVDTIALLGDLFDRHEQADRCAAPMASWNVVGVYGNHELEAAEAAAHGDLALHAVTHRLLGALLPELRVDVEDALFVHEAEGWGITDPLARMFGPANTDNGRRRARITFAGHTHVRHARDERGPLDTARGVVALDPTRHYLINPGALAAGQFAIWDRDARAVRFLHVEW